jgi:hypothetical protein
MNSDQSPPSVISNSDSSYGTCGSSTMVSELKEGGLLHLLCFMLEHCFWRLRWNGWRMIIHTISLSICHYLYIFIYDITASEKSMC